MVSLKDAIRILEEQGQGPTPDRPTYTCPRCKNGALTITLNGTGLPEFDCANGCPAIDATIQTIASMPHPHGPHIDLIATLRHDLGLPELDKIIKHGRGGSSYDLHLDDGRIIAIGSISILTVQAKFRTAFLPQMRRNPKRHKTADWDNVVEKIEQAAEERDAVATQADETLSWIAASLNTNKLRRNVNIDNSAEMFDLLASGTGGKPPFFDQVGRLHLRLEHMIEWLGGRASIKVSMPELSARLSTLDFERVQHAARSSDTVRKARYWVSPLGIEDQL